MEQLVGFREFYGTSRFYQTHGSTEMIVYRSPFEQPLFHSFPFSYLIVEALQYDRQVLYQEHATENRYQQFFVDDNS